MDYLFYVGKISSLSLTVEKQKRDITLIKGYLTMNPADEPDQVQNYSFQEERAKYGEEKPRTKKEYYKGFYFT